MNRRGLLLFILVSVVIVACIGDDGTPTVTKTPSESTSIPRSSDDHDVTPTRTSILLKETNTPRSSDDHDVIPTRTSILLKETSTPRSSDEHDVIPTRTSTPPNGASTPHPSDEHDVIPTRTSTPPNGTSTPHPSDDHDMIPTRTSTPPNGTSTPHPSDHRGFNLLVVAEGQVELKREGWPAYQETALGAMLRRGDQIRPSDDAKLVILCDNLSPWDVPAGVPSGLNGCPQPEESLLIRNGNLIYNTRGASNPFIPYIISPRMTRLLTNQPRLRWNKVLGASSYTVKLQGIEWEAELNGTEIVYPGNPPLEHGRSYLLIIEADNDTKSTDEEPIRLGFVLLSPEDAEIVQTHTSTVNGLNLPDESKALAIAHLYAGQGLMAEAIDTLETFAHNGSQTAATYRLLGDLYLQIGLPLLAESHYTQAITLSDTINDIEGKATAQAGLGKVYSALNKEEQARHWLEEAQRGYEALGDSERLRDVEVSLEELEQ